MCKAQGLRAVGPRGELLARLYTEGGATGAGAGVGGGGGATVRAKVVDGVRALCIGNSQDPDNDPAAAGRRGAGCRRECRPLEQIRADVQVSADLGCADFATPEPNIDRSGIGR